jgi:1-acyl-sn-glycerol-3-phosphate acyltransferase
LNPLLYAFYQLLKVIVRLALRIFYPSKKYIHPERLRFDYPAILVSNHPNTLLDPLTAAAKTKKLVFFLANAGLFKSAFGNWFFNTFYCIPVTRPQDNGGKKKISNEDSFARANEHLTNGGVLYIAPEGTSEMERRLRPLKTGTARIALSTEKKNNYQLGMAIVPVGLTYYRPRNCGSRQIVSVGEPIFPQQYGAAYEEDPIQTVKDLTADLENSMRQLMIDTADETQDQRLRLLESIRQNEKPLKGEERFRRERELLRFLKEEANEAWLLQLDQYGESLQKYKVKDRDVQPSAKRINWTTLLLSPIYLYGKINNFLPTQIPVWVNKKLDLYPGYSATVKILVGLITIPLFYWLQTKLISSYFGQGWYWPYLLSLPLSGIIAWRFSGWWRRVSSRRRFYGLQEEQKQELRTLRSAIIDPQS